MFVLGKDYIDETKDTLLMGEDSREDLSANDIPVRFLTDFYLYDPHRDGEYITLADLPSSDQPGSKTRFKAVGNAPIMKQNLYQINSTYRFQAVIQFLRKELGWPAGDALVRARPVVLQQWLDNHPQVYLHQPCVLSCT